MSATTLKDRLVELLRSPHYQPLTKSGLARALDLPPDRRAGFRDLLRDLVTEGVVLSGRKGLYSLRSRSAKTLAGTLRFLSSGGAHFLPDKDDPDNRAPLQALGFDLADDVRVYIPEHERGTALPGDRVTVKAGPGRRDPSNIEGRIVSVLERCRRPFVGTLKRRGKALVVQPDDSTLPQFVDLAGTNESLTKAGNKVLAVIEAWDHHSQRPRGRLVKDLGPPDTPGLGILAIIHKFCLPTEFPADVMREVAAIPNDVPADEIARREDWRDREVVTIDPDDAKDFDDAISVTPLPGGGWELAVHIADVSFYVRPGSALDREAQNRGNSVYLADRVIPMLPEKLSNGLCSLQPNVERLTQVAVLRFDAKGRRTHSRFARAVIRSQRRFSYEEAFQEMKASNAKLRSPALDRAWPLASLLRRKRFQAGSLDLDFAEVKAKLDKEGRPVGLVRIEHDESHQLIEEFMLAANEAVAKAIKDATVPGIYRIHDDPDEEKLAEYRMFLGTCGIVAGDLTQRSELQRVLQSLRGRPDEHALKIGLLKSLKRAAYEAEPRGHYGLAKSNYTHFTSPIRRYADLVVHRVLANLGRRSRGSKPSSSERMPPQARMGEIAAHLSITERTAAEAEQESQRLMQTQYFANLLRLKTVPTFAAAVVDVRRIGLFIELTEFPIRGLVKREDFPEGDFHFDAPGMRFYSRHPRASYHLGAVIKAAPLSVDLGRRLIDFRIVG